MTAYLIAFVLTVWPHLTKYQDREMRAIAAEVAATDGTAQEDLRLMNIAALESGFSRKAVGKMGERGAFQVLGGKDFSAKEALRRMRVQGMDHYCGCRTTCPALVANRIDRADLYRMGFEPPTTTLIASAEEREREREPHEESEFLASH